MKPLFKLTEQKRAQIHGNDKNDGIYNHGLDAVRDQGVFNGLVHGLVVGSEYTGNVGHRAQIVWGFSFLAYKAVDL